MKNKVLQKINFYQNIKKKKKITIFVSIFESIKINLNLMLKGFKPVLKLKKIMSNKQYTASSIHYIFHIIIIKQLIHQNKEIFKN